MRKGFLYIFFSHTDFSLKIQIFLVIYTDFVLDQSGRSVIIKRIVILENNPNKATERNAEKLLTIPNKATAP